MALSFITIVNILICDKIAFTDIDKQNPITNLLNQFIRDNSFYRCDTLFDNNCTVSTRMGTYYNEALGAESYIDYFLARCVGDIMSYKTLDPATLTTPGRRSARLMLTRHNAIATFHWLYFNVLEAY